MIPPLTSLGPGVADEPRGGKQLLKVGSGDQTQVVMLVQPSLLVAGPSCQPCLLLFPLHRFWRTSNWVTGAFPAPALAYDA